jgi:hypothetical protein
MIVSDRMPTALVVLLVIMFFAGISALLSRAGGWYALSKQYSRPPGARVLRRSWLMSGKIGRAYYRACLVVGVDVDGVFLSCLPPFNVGAPALYIPWRALRFVTRSKFLWVPALRLRTEDGTPIDLFGSAADLVDRAGPWPQ